MAEKNNVEDKLEPTNKFATVFTKVTAVVLCAIAASKGLSAATDRSLYAHERATEALLAAGSAVAAVTAWDSASGASRARNFVEKVNDVAAANAALGAIR